MDRGVIMNSFFKKYRIELETVGPIFIGSGEIITKKEYLVSQTKAEMVDMKKLWAIIKKKGKRREFEEFFLSNDSNHKDLLKWLRNNDITLSDYQDAILYSMDFGTITAEKNKERSLVAFVKDPYGQPYIPGSSLKGMIHTVLTYYLISNPSFEQYVETKKEAIKKEINNLKSKGRNFLQKEEKDMDDIFFRECNPKDKEQVVAEWLLERMNLQKQASNKKSRVENNWLTGIKIRDSEPVETSRLVLCQKIDVGKSGKERILPLVRECIKPKTKIEFELIIDTKIVNESIVDVIKKAIEHCFKTYQEQYLSKFDDYKEDKETYCYLGGGAGYHSKSYIYALYKESECSEKVVKIFEKVLGNKFFEHKYDQYVRGDLVPRVKKCTLYENKLMEFGKCKIKFIKQEI